MAFAQSEVWWGPAPQKSSPSYRPWVIMSDDTHPFSHTECIVVAMTTQQHDGAISVPNEAWVRGGSNKKAYISPWYAMTIKQRDLDSQQGTLTPDIVAKTIEELRKYTPQPG